MGSFWCEIWSFSWKWWEILFWESNGVFYVLILPSYVGMLWPCFKCFIKFTDTGGEPRSGLLKETVKPGKVASRNSGFCVSVFRTWIVTEESQNRPPYSSFSARAIQPTDCHLQPTCSLTAWHLQRRHISKVAPAREEHLTDCRFDFIIWDLNRVTQYSRQEGNTCPGRVLCWLERFPNTPRLRVQNLVRAHTTINQWMYKWVEQQSTFLFPSLSSPLSF